MSNADPTEKPRVNFALDILNISTYNAKYQATTQQNKSVAYSITRHTHVFILK